MGRNVLCLDLGVPGGSPEFVHQSMRHLTASSVLFHSAGQCLEHTGKDQVM